MKKKEPGAAGELLELLLALPPKLEEARLLLESERISAADIDLAAFRYVEACQWEAHDALGETPDPRRGTVPGLHSTYLPEVLSLLLDYGLDPNTVIDDYELMHLLFFVDNEYLGADALALLLERGGDPEWTVDEESGESSYDVIFFDISAGASKNPDRRVYDYMVHYWMVLLGYGAGAKTPVNVFSQCPAYVYFDELQFSTSDLIAHRNYRWGLSFVPGRGEGWSLHIFDERSGWEVLRL